MKRSASDGSTRSDVVSTTSATRSASARARRQASGAPSISAESANWRRKGVCSRRGAPPSPDARRIARGSTRTKSDPTHSTSRTQQKTAWAYFEAQAPWYRRAATWYVLSAKREETRLKRLAILIEDSANKRWLAGLIRTDQRPAASVGAKDEAQASIAAEGGAKQRVAAKAETKTSVAAKSRSTKSPARKR